MIEVIPCTLAHIREAALFLRREECIECAAVGVKPRHIMHALWKQTPTPLAAISNGVVLAVGGDTAGTLAAEGHLWMFTTMFVDSVPISFVKALRAEIERFLETRSTVVTSCHESCERTMRLFRSLGFEVEPAAREGFVNLRFEGG